MGQFAHSLNALLLAFCICLAFAGLWPRPVRADEAGAPVVGWIEIAPVPGQPDQIVITGKVYGVRQTEGRFTMEVRRRERGNVSNGNQGGDFKVAPGETATLSRSSITVSPAGSLEIILKLSVDGHVVFSTRSASGA